MMTVSEGESLYCQKMNKSAKQWFFFIEKKKTLVSQISHCTSNPASSFYRWENENQRVGWHYTRWGSLLGGSWDSRKQIPKKCCLIYWPRVGLFLLLKTLSRGEKMIPYLYTLFHLTFIYIPLLRIHFFPSSSKQFKKRFVIWVQRMCHGLFFLIYEQ